MIGWYQINIQKCSTCGLCADVCPFDVISPIGVYRIDPDKCTGCDLSLASCPSDAIEEV